MEEKTSRSQETIDRRNAGADRVKQEYADVGSDSQQHSGINRVANLTGNSAIVGPASTVGATNSNHRDQQQVFLRRQTLLLTSTTNATAKDASNQPAATNTSQQQEAAMVKTKRSQG